ncbi:MAG: TIGR03915 family putative DNA repair protein [Candidatus Limivivens sp.]|nr:TIGR03915 family putative DNA repair protein [Candidatus Limivivens sp.]
MTVFLCEGTVDGILTGVYDAWDSRLGHENVRLAIEENWNQELFAKSVSVPTDGTKAGKVARTVQRELGQETWENIYRAALSQAEERADSIYRTIVLGLTAKKGRKDLMNHLQNPDICRVFELSRYVWHEAHHYLGFVRFRELQGGVLFSEIHPRARILTLLGDHFAGRYPMEHFLIYDGSHGEFLAHQAGKQWVLVQGEEPDQEKLWELGQQEEAFQKLWQVFLDTIAIESRINPGLQLQMLPKRFRADLTEKL